MAMPDQVFQELAPALGVDVRKPTTLFTEFAQFITFRCHGEEEVACR